MEGGGMTFTAEQVLAQIEQAYMTHNTDTFYMTKLELAVYEALRAWRAA